MKVYFMRHGESEYNVVRRINFDPRIKVGLTVKGIDQVNKAAQKFSGMRFDAIFSSRFLRTKQTAKIMARGRRIRVRTDRRLNEFRTGFEGENVQVYYDALEGAEVLSEFKVDGFESFLDVKLRVYEFLQDLKKKNYARVLIVAHEAVVNAARVLFNEISDEDTFVMKVGNTQTFMFDM